MGKVKQAIEEVKEEIEDIISNRGGDVELEEVKAILQNKYTIDILWYMTIYTPSNFIIYPSPSARGI